MVRRLVASNTAAAEVRNKRSRRSLAIFIIAACLLVSIAALSPARADAAWINALKGRDVAELMRLVDAGVDVFSTDASGKNAMMVAARADHIPLLNKLLTAGLDVNAKNRNGGTALMFASVGGNVSSVRWLVEHGAQLDQRASNGWTAMTLAAAKGHVDVVSRLLAQGADPAIADIYGWTPLMRAVEQYRANVVQILLESENSAIDASNELGASALHRAAALGLKEIVCQLLLHGADTGSIDNENRTPARTARLSGHPEIEFAIKQGRCDSADW